MATFGFIGTGNMGGALVKAVAKTVPPTDIMIANRTRAKADALAREVGCRVCHNADVCWSDFIFLGVKPAMIGGVIDEIRDDFVTRFNYDSTLKLYVMSFTEKWDYTEEKPRTGEIITEQRRIYLHYYYNDQKATDDKNRFNAMLDRLENNLINGTVDPADKKLYDKYFVINETPVRGITYSFKEEAIRKTEKNYGYFVLMSNGIKDPVEALRIYRLKDLIEKSFGNLKERLSMRRMSVASEENFEGKLFVQFIALQLMSYIKKQMDENGLFSNYTLQSLLDELDIIEYYQQPGKAHHLSEITEKQRNLYTMMDVAVPT